MGFLNNSYNWRGTFAGVAEPFTSPGLVCAHHHLYSALARGMPAPPATPRTFLQVLELVWWRLDRALDLEMLEWSAKLAAVEALQAGCTAIVDHHESPNAIDGSLSVIADACGEVGVRVVCAYGVTDRHGAEGASRGLAENDRFLREGGRGMVGVHAAFTCTDDTLAAATELAERHRVGVHIHVAEGPDDVDAPTRLAGLTDDRWLLIHGVHLADGHGLRGTIVHNPRSNMNNAVGYARPVRFDNPVALGTDGIGADMLDEFRVAFVRAREDDLTVSPDLAWEWLTRGWDLVPEARDDRVTWNYPTIEPWRLAYSTGVNAIDVDVDGQPVLRDGQPTRVDGAEVRAKAAEQAQRLFRALDELD
jgi:cytosine/adenosine deaminase-related metal-dependent hydrolase